MWTVFVCVPVRWKLNRQICPQTVPFASEIATRTKSDLTRISRAGICLAGSKSRSLDHGLKALRAVGRGSRLGCAEPAGCLLRLLPSSFHECHRFLSYFQGLLGCLLRALWPLSLNWTFPIPSSFLSCRHSTYHACLSHLYR